MQEEDRVKVTDGKYRSKPGKIIGKAIKRIDGEEFYDPNLSDVWFVELEDGKTIPIAEGYLEVIEE